MLKNIFIILICILLLPSLNNKLCIEANENKNETLELGVESKGCILIDVLTNKVIYEKNADDKLYPASMTKMMGMLLILEAIEDRKIKFEQEVTISNEASKMGGSQVYLEAGETMTIEELFKCVTIASANDAMYALAETVAGSEFQFVNTMNKKAKEIGMINTNFNNTTGFDDKNHYSTPRDMAKLARELMFKYEQEVTKYSSLKESYIREDTSEPFWLVNTNRLLGDYDGLDGLKTGFTQDAGFCLTATAKRDNFRLISVVMKSNTKEIRSKDTIKLLDYGFSNYKCIKIYDKDEVIGSCSFKHARKENIPIIIKNDVYISIKKEENINDIIKEIYIYKTSAPIKENEKIGVLKVKNSENYYIEIDIYVKEKVEFLHWYDYFIDILMDMLL